MNLKDELLKLGRETETDFQSVMNCLRVMFNTCMTYLKENNKLMMSDEERGDMVKDVNTIWMEVSDILRAEGRGFVSKAGFATIMRQRIGGSVNPEMN